MLCLGFAVLDTQVVKNNYNSEKWFNKNKTPKSRRKSEKRTMKKKRKAKKLSPRTHKNIIIIPALYFRPHPSRHPGIIPPAAS